MICPDCGSNSKTLDTRQRFSNRYRRRKCVNTKCEKTFTTREIYNKEWKDSKQIQTLILMRNDLLKIIQDIEKQIQI